MNSYLLSTKKKKSRHLVLWSLENLMVYESLGRGINYVNERHITPSAPYL